MMPGQCLRTGRQCDINVYPRKRSDRIEEIGEKHIREYETKKHKPVYLGLLYPELP